MQRGCVASKLSGITVCALLSLGMTLMPACGGGGMGGAQSVDDDFDEGPLFEDASTAESDGGELSVGEESEPASDAGEPDASEHEADLAAEDEGPAELDPGHDAGTQPELPALLQVASAPDAGC